MQIPSALRRHRCAPPRSTFGAAGTALLLALAAVPATAQTDYYNLDAGRPLRIEDAVAIERHAFEWQMAPLRVSGARGAGTLVALEPELAWGVLPRTQVEVGLPLQRWQRGERVVLGAAGIDLSILHALNAETMGLPALALAAHVLIPAGAFGASSAYPTFTAIATRTTSIGRLHLNASYTAGLAEAQTTDAQPALELTRWQAGLAVDRSFPLRSFLLGAELLARQPIDEAEGVEWSAATGLRYQLSPRVGLDAGVGRDLARGGEWFVTFGSAVSFSLLHRLGGVR